MSGKKPGGRPKQQTSPTETHITEHKHGGLGQLASTAICGNDITSSCLYVSGLAIAAAHKIAPISLLIVAAVLFLFRSIYAEVVGALPLNGGAYNALLNTTSKYRASIAACLTILSYMATAVISAYEAMEYAHHLWSGLPVMFATTVLLAIFMALTIWGITESSRVAIAIFIFHLSTLTLLLVASLIYVATSEAGTSIFRANMTAELSVHERMEEESPRASEDLPASMPEASAVEGADALNNEHDNERPNEQDGEPKTLIYRTIGLGTALFFGFSVSLLGISGFESSSNFVEEQAEGVFPKTLRNMWYAVSFFNPVMALLAMSLLPIATIQQDESVRKTLLAEMGGVVAGKPLAMFISVDAILVLSGAVLTSFVGVNGLVRRMTLDRCLPQFLLKTNARGTTHRIIIAFFVLSVSVLLITEGDVERLAGVYTISFLSVMALFGLGNVLLKVNRASLPRPARAAWGTVILAVSAVVVGLIGNAIKDPEYLKVFLFYFVPALLIVSIMLWRIGILTTILYVVRAATRSLVKPMNDISTFVRRKIDEINSQQVVFFTRGDNLAHLNSAMLYVSQNEHTNRIKVVTVVTDKSHVPAKLEHDLKFLDEAYPNIDIEFVALEGKFTPELIQQLSQEWNIPTNLMFIGSPGGHFMYGLAELGGVRLII
ncbi:MAG: APC family permease [Pirellulaceae bacterium]|nr:APC family permease [Planctomycetales bacterium]